MRMLSPSETETRRTRRIDTIPGAESEWTVQLLARWDAAQQIWYVRDVADLTPFTRWIPDLKAAAG